MSRNNPQTERMDEEVMAAGSEDVFAAGQCRGEPWKQNECFWTASSAQIFPKPSRSWYMSRVNTTRLYALASTMTQLGSPLECRIHGRGDTVSPYSKEIEEGLIAGPNRLKWKGNSWMASGDKISAKPAKSFFITSV